MADDVDWAALMAEGRYEEFLLQMRLGAERQARIAALRPQWDELGRRLLTFRDAVHRSLVEPVTDPLAPIELRPAASDSTQAAETAARSAARLDSEHALLEEQLRSYTGAISDHLWGLAAAMAADPPVRPAFVIGRVLLDAAAHLHHLTDPAIDAAQRTVRAVNIRLGALYDELQDFEDGDDDAARPRREVDDLLAAARKDGFTPIPRRRGANQYCLEPRVPPTGELAAELLGSLGPGAWRTLSSTVHAQDRPVLDLSTGRGDFASSPQGRSAAALQLAASVLMCTEAIARTVRLRGLDDSLTNLAANALNTAWSAAAGLNDEVYAAQVD